MTTNLRLTRPPQRPPLQVLFEPRVLVGDPAAPSSCYLDLAGLVGQAQIVPGASLTLRSLVVMNLGAAAAAAATEDGGESPSPALANFTSMFWLLDADRSARVCARVRVRVSKSVWRRGEGGLPSGAFGTRTHHHHHHTRIHTHMHHAPSSVVILSCGRSLRTASVHARTHAHTHTATHSHTHTHTHAHTHTHTRARAHTHAHTQVRRGPLRTLAVPGRRHPAPPRA